MKTSDYENMCMYNEIPKATAQKAIQRDTLKRNMVVISKWKSKNIQVTHRKAEKWKERNENERNKQYKK